MNPSRPIPLLLSILLVVGAALQVSSFAKAEPWNPGTFVLSDYLGLLQVFLMQTLGLYIILIPPIKDETLRIHMGGWIAVMSVSSIGLGGLSLGLYTTAGLAWSNLLSFFSCACQSFVVLQLIRGLQRSGRAALKKDHSN